VGIAILVCGRRHLDLRPSPSWFVGVAILVCGRHHVGLWASPSWFVGVTILVFLQPEVTQEGGANYKQPFSGYNELP